MARPDEASSPWDANPNLNFTLQKILAGAVLHREELIQCIESLRDYTCLRSPGRT
jgi:hypothetical protein